MSTRLKFGEGHARPITQIRRSGSVGDVPSPIGRKGANLDSTGVYWNPLGAAARFGKRDILMAIKIYSATSGTTARRVGYAVGLASNPDRAKRNPGSTPRSPKSIMECFAISRQSAGSYVEHRNPDCDALHPAYACYASFGVMLASVTHTSKKSFPSGVKCIAIRA